MPIKLGNQDISKAYLGSQELSQIYLGTVPLLSATTIPFVETFNEQTQTGNQSLYTWTNRNVGTDNPKRVVVACVSCEGSNTNADLTVFNIGGVDVIANGRFIDRFRRSGSNVNACAIGWAEVSGTTINVTAGFDAQQRAASLVVVTVQDVNDIDAVLNGSGAGANVNERVTADKDVVQDSVCIGIASASSENRTINDYESGSQNFTTRQTYTPESRYSAHFGYVENLNAGVQACRLLLDANTDRLTLCAIWIN